MNVLIQLGFVKQFIEIYVNIVLELQVSKVS